ncbi:MAG: hypothetical protein K5666_01260 [Bacilli bacterium]|nr:hypothetical protein [Bacilli bacterium]
MEYKDLSVPVNMIDKDAVSYLIDLLMESGNYTEGFYSMASEDANNISPVDYEKEEQFVNKTLQSAILVKDRQSIMDLAGLSSLEELYREIKTNPDFSENIKGYLKDTIYSEDGKYYNLNSKYMFPNVEELKMKGDVAYRIIVNSNASNYFDVVSAIYTDFVNNDIPFKMHVRMINDNNNFGYTDPIVLYTSEEELNRTCDALKEILTELSDKISRPDEKLGHNWFDLFSTIEVKEVKGKYVSSLDEILFAIENALDYYLESYIKSSPEFGEYESTWEGRKKALNFIKEKAGQVEIDNIVEGIMLYLKEKNYNLDNIYELESNNKVKEEVVQPVTELAPIEAVTSVVPTDEQVLELSVESEPYTEEVDEHKYDIYEDDERIKSEFLKDEFFAGFDNEDDDKVAVMPTVEPVQNNAPTPEDSPMEPVQTIEPMVEPIEQEAPVENLQPDEQTPEVPPMEPVVEEPIIPQHTIEDLLGATQEIKVEEPVESESFDYVDDTKVEPSEQSVSEVSSNQEPELSVSYVDLSETQQINNLVDLIKENTKEIPTVSAEEVETEPVEEAETKTFDDVKKQSAQPIIEGYSEVDPKEFIKVDVEGEDEVEANLGNNYGNGNTGEIDIKPITGSAEVMTDEEAYNLTSSIYEQGKIEGLLGEYTGIISAEDAAADIVIDQAGNTTKLIDYIKVENLIAKVPVDKDFVDIEDDKMKGIDFIQKYVIPQLKNNTADRVLTIDDILDNYSKTVAEEKPKKKGFFARLFHR